MTQTFLKTSSSHLGNLLFPPVLPPPSSEVLLLLLHLFRLLIIRRLVNLDAGMASQLVTIKVLEKLQSRFGDLYTEENVAISGIHTHAGPGGYLQYLIYSITSLGFVQQSFDAIVKAIEQSIVLAHNNLKPGSIFIKTGDVENAGINRSPSAYLLNPAEERARYLANVDKEMTLLKFVDEATGNSIGAFSWYAIHGTSMSKDNLLISGDNKGAAARFRITKKLV